jgi:penicillin-binding protein 1C
MIRLTKRRKLSAAGGTIALAAVGWLRCGPVPAELLDNRRTASVVVLDRNDRPLYEALSADGSRSETLEASDLPPAIVDATIAAEDRRFWWHPGIDPIAIVRACLADIRHGGAVEGGSTISQQAAKLLLGGDGSRHRGIRAKISEALLALRLEHRFSKREILAMYLNRASYGNQIAGVERASHAYFGRPSKLLTPAQAAFLAGLPQRPSGFNPYRSFNDAVRRQRSVLRRMAATHVLSDDQVKEALAERLVLVRDKSPFAAPHFVEMALAAAGDARTVRTTLDRELQADVVGILRARRDLLTSHGAYNVAVVVLDNASSEWLAWEGSSDYFDNEHGGAINGPSVARQPGSALKPLTYALAFDQGFTPASVLADVPSHFPTADPGVLYTPRNYDGRYRGPLLARVALAGSENVPAVSLASEIGIPSLLRFYQRAGLTTLSRNASYYGLGLTLGNAEVRLDELTAAYAAFARGGVWISPAFLRDAPKETRSLVSQRASFWIGDILSDADAREFIFGRGGSLEFPFPVAAKTGTSQAYHDNWTLGFSRHVTVGVWVGNFDRSPLRDSTGVTGAGPIFHAVMLAAERRYGPVTDDSALATPPVGVQGVRERAICALSGLAANEWCPVKKREWMPADVELLPCSWHHLDDGDLRTYWPAEYQMWAKETVHGVQRVAGMQRVPSAPAADVFRIASPAHGSTYLIDPTLRREFQSLSLRVVSSTHGAVEWWIDGRPVARTAVEPAGSWPLTAGTHTFIARDEYGRTATSTVTVR